jgi:hypothetical protein
MGGGSRGEASKSHRFDDSFLKRKDPREAAGQGGDKLKEKLVLLAKA